MSRNIASYAIDIKCIRNNIFQIVFINYIVFLYISFFPDAYEAEQLLKEVDIHSVTGVLKLYLRELPEALFTDALYPELLKAWGATQVRIKYSQQVK